MKKYFDVNGNQFWKGEALRYYDKKEHLTRKGYAKKVGETLHFISFWDNEDFGEKVLSKCEIIPCDEDFD